jgi:predicted nucleic acid-binding protein
MKIALDTNVLIYATKLLSEDTYVIDAHYFIKRIKDEGIDTIVPAPALAEFLFGYPTQDHGKVIRSLQSWAFIAPFDVAAASLSAKLNKDAMKPNTRGERTRTEVKTDAQILACSIIHGASAFYT